MGKTTFTVKVMHKGRERDYRDFWQHGVTSNSAGEELHSALVGFTETVEARNKAEAIALVREKHPGLQVDTEATERHG
jgi:hypothetical protein